MIQDEQSLKPQQLSLTALVESLLFVADEPVEVATLAQVLEVDMSAVEAALAELFSDGIQRGVRLQRKGNQVQWVTRPEAAGYVEKFLGLETSGRLSQAALETLSIIAYRQPCTRAQVEVVRGVNCDGVLSTLLTKGLIEEVGRLETVGHPFLYGTTFDFLRHFGLKSLDDLPPLEPTQTPTLVEPESNAQVSVSTEITAESQVQPDVGGETPHTEPGLNE